MWSQTSFECLASAKNPPWTSRDRESNLLIHGIQRKAEKLNHGKRKHGAESQRKSRTQIPTGSLPLLFASYPWFFLWVGLFVFSTGGFSLSGEQHGLWQHLNVASSNFVKQRLGETEKEAGGWRERNWFFSKCKMKKFQRSAGLELR